MRIETSDNVEKESERKPGFWAQFNEGFSFIKKQPKIITGLVILSAMILVLQICDSQFAILMREIPNQPIMLLGWLMAGSGLGMALAAIYLNKKVFHSPLLPLALASGVVGIGYILCASFIHLPVIIVMISYPLLGIIVGFFCAIGFIQFNVLAQKTTPNHFTGRVFGTIGSITTLAAVIGMVSGGVISELFGAIFTFILAGSLLVLVGIIVYIGRSRFEGGDQIAESDSGTHSKAQG